LIINNQSGYTTGYKFLKVATLLIAKDLSGYIDVTGVSDCVKLSKQKNDDDDQQDQSG